MSAGLACALRNYEEEKSIDSYKQSILFSDHPALSRSLIEIEPSIEGSTFQSESEDPLAFFFLSI